jgi:hypothetical protein
MKESESWTIFRSDVKLKLSHLLLGFVPVAGVVDEISHYLELTIGSRAHVLTKRPSAKKVSCTINPDLSCLRVRGKRRRHDTVVGTESTHYWTTRRLRYLYADRTVKAELGLDRVIVLHSGDERSIRLAHSFHVLTRVVWAQTTNNKDQTEHVSSWLGLYVVNSAISFYFFEWDSLAQTITTTKILEYYSCFLWGFTSLCSVSCVNGLTQVVVQYGLQNVKVSSIVLAHTELTGFWIQDGLPGRPLFTTNLQLRGTWSSVLCLSEREEKQPLTSNHHKLTVIII